MLKLLIGRFQGIISKYTIPIFLLILVGATTRAFYYGLELGHLQATKNAVAAQIEAVNKAREDEQSYYRKQLAILKQSHANELALEKANVKIQTVIETKYITKEKVCVTKEDGGFTFSNGYVSLYNESVRAANSATAETNRPGTISKMQADEGSREQRPVETTSGSD